MPPTEPTQETATPPKTSRFRLLNLFRFRLRTLFVMMVLVAVSLGWWSHRTHQQRAAVEYLKTKVEIAYDYQEDGLKKPRYWPTWLIDMLGIDYFANVTTLCFLINNVNQSDLEHIKNLTELRALYLSETDVTGVGFSELKHLKALECLYLNETKVTDAGLKHLKNFTALESLNLDRTQITDLGIKHLHDLTALKHLFLEGAQITDSGLEHLRNLSTLEILCLERTQVTDLGLEHLKNLTNLNYITLPDTQVTDEGVARLKKALPNCQIDR